jgi:hypothetical protein
MSKPTPVNANERRRAAGLLVIAFMGLVLLSPIDGVLKLIILLVPIPCAIYWMDIRAAIETNRKHKAAVAADRAAAERSRQERRGDQVFVSFVIRCFIVACLYPVAGIVFSMIFVALDQPGQVGHVFWAFLFLVFAAYWALRFVARAFR